MPPATKATDIEEHLKLRVITPELARSCSNINNIAPLPEPLALSCTLQDLRSRVSQHLGLAEPPIPSLECNCAFASRINTDAVLRAASSGDVDTLHTLVVVHGDSQVTTVHIEEPVFSSMEYSAKSQLQGSATGKTLEVKGGIKDDSVPRSKRYLKLPVMAICSPEAHGVLSGEPGNHFRWSVDSNIANEYDHSPGSQRLCVDLHISECPIEITAHNASVTLKTASLHDCTIDGVLNVFAVPHLYPMADNASSSMFEYPASHSALDSIAPSYSISDIAD